MVALYDYASSMTHGANAAVAVLLIALMVVLIGIVCAVLFWRRRAQIVKVQSILRGESPGE